MEQLLPVCGFLCLYPMLVGALPMWLYMKYGRRLKVTIVDEDEVVERKAARPPVSGYATLREKR